MKRTAPLPIRTSVGGMLDTTTDPQDPATPAAPIGAPRVQHRQLSDPNWRRFFDTLGDAGVDKLSTSAASGMAPQKGFFDNQGHDPYYDGQAQSLLALKKVQGFRT